MKVGNRDFEEYGRTYVMGILNVTPDSFSDGGKFNSIDSALKQVEKMVAEGADIIDIGGESTRPGYTPISDEEEIQRVVPVIEKVKGNFDIPISLDTYKSAVAAEGIKVGADLINDIWGLKYDENMAKVIGDSGLPCCLTHNRKDAEYENFMLDVVNDLQDSLALAKKGGIKEDKIILDPGIGFGKTYGQNLEILAKLDMLHCFDLPLLLGASRKSVIGSTLDLPVNDLLEGTLATTVLGVYKGCMFVRVHDVKENLRAIRMTEAIKNSSY